jgi:hypothetical protein
MCSLAQLEVAAVFVAVVACVGFIVGIDAGLLAIAGATPLLAIAHQELIGQLFGTLVQETRELPDGYAYRFQNEHYPLVATFITNEQLCCPFLTFELTVTPHRGPVWLQLTAPGDVKPFLKVELGYYIPQR